jgi:hypothetical protein
VVVNDLDLESLGVSPSKTDAPLIVDPNAVLPFAVSRERLQPIAWNGRQIGQRRRRMDMIELSFRNASDLLELSAKLSTEDALGLFVAE